jgi:hypothetical protein
VDEIKFSAWNLLRVRAKDFTYNLYEWNTNPLVCMGMAGTI